MPVFVLTFLNIPDFCRLIFLYANQKPEMDIPRPAGLNLGQLVHIDKKRTGGANCSAGGLPAIGFCRAFPPSYWIKKPKAY